jgi:hypothetical protein
MFWTGLILLLTLWPVWKLFDWAIGTDYPWGDDGLAYWMYVPLLQLIAGVFLLGFSLLSTSGQK